MDLLKSILEGFELALQHGAALSVFLGLFISIAGTQYVKKLEAFPSKSIWIRSLALPLGFFPTFFTWPIHEMSAVRIFLSLAVGLGAPFIYSGAVALIRYKWPAFADKLSASPPEP
jgi:hypothetical protein